MQVTFALRFICKWKRFIVLTLQVCTTAYLKKRVYAAGNLMTLTFLLFQLITHEEKRERIYEADFRYVRSEVDKKTGLPNLCTKYD